jgi:hypothetical protein
MLAFLLIAAISVIANSIYRSKFKALLVSVPLGLTVLGTALAFHDVVAKEREPVLAFADDFAFWGIFLVAGYVAVASLFHYCFRRRHLDLTTTA